MIDTNIENRFKISKKYKVPKKIVDKNTKDYNKTTYFKEDYKNLKDEILENTLYCYKINCLLNKEKEQFKHQIQQLLKEQTNERNK